jgi:hypothetical protein
MNKRVAELRAQCIVREQRGTNAFDSYMVDRFDTEKFAELILIEVTDILSTYRGKMVFEDGAEYNYEHPIIAIRKHFGVKDWT